MNRLVRLNVWAAGKGRRFFSRNRRSRVAISWLCGLPIFCAIVAPLYGDTAPAELFPDPKLSPQQVVEFQLSALRANDVPSTDAGIERAFRFASPGNKAAIGPLDHFTAVVHSTQYSPLLNAAEGTVAKVAVQDTQAEAVVRVVSSTGSEVFYLFILSKQTMGDYIDCWMTDAVLRLKPGEGEESGTAI